MAYGQGQTIIDFGAGQNEAEVTITGLINILNTSKAEVYVMGDDTTLDHTANDHKYLPTLASFCCGNFQTGYGFTIYARSIHKLNGKFAIRYTWAD
jgi:hypothetical protein